MNPLLEQLHDIEGLDSISVWPLAIGWWVIIGIAILMACVLMYLLIRKIAYLRSWRNDTIQKLDFLEQNLSKTTSKETVMILSEYLRRIVLRRFARKECAGLVGEAWLKWLTTNDPKKFDWEKKGILLINTPYSPVNHTIPANDIKELIKAVRNWVI